MRIEKAAVVGAGTMGAGIAQVLSQAGIEVILKDVSQDFIDRGLASIKRTYDSRVKKEVLTESEAGRLCALVKPATTYDGFTDVDLVVEAAPELLQVKREIFTELSRRCPAHAILASNTSALSISELGSFTKHPENVLGMHFFNPAPVMKLVEVIPGVRTAPAIVKEVLELCRTLGKIPVEVQECPGFLSNRVLFPYLHEALYVLEEGASPCQETDAAALAFGLPMGPFLLFDVIGLDVCHHISQFLYDSYGTRCTPPALLGAMVEKGFLGQKSGSGFYMHGPGAPQKDQPRQVNPEVAALVKMSPTRPAGKPFAVERIILPMFNEAVYAVQEGVVAPADIDIAMAYGFGLKRGLMTLAEDKGFRWCASELEDYRRIYGDRFRPAWLMNKLACAGVHDFKSMTPALAAR